MLPSRQHWQPVGQLDGVECETDAVKGFFSGTGSNGTLRLSSLQTSIDGIAQFLLYRLAQVFGTKQTGCDVRCRCATEELTTDERDRILRTNEDRRLRLIARLRRRCHYWHC